MKPASSHSHDGKLEKQWEHLTTVRLLCGGQWALEGGACVQTRPGPPVSGNDYIGREQAVLCGPGEALKITAQRAARHVDQLSR